MTIAGLKIEDGVVLSLNEQSGNWERGSIDLVSELEELLRRLENLSYSIDDEESIILSDDNKCSRSQDAPLSTDSGKMTSRDLWLTNHNAEHARLSLENVGNHMAPHTHPKKASLKELNGHKTALMSMLKCLDKHYYGRLNQDYPEPSGISYIRKDTANTRCGLNGDLIKCILRYNRLYNVGTSESKFYLENTGASKDPH